MLDMSDYLTLTPAGVFHAFLHANADDKAMALQALLAEKVSIERLLWVQKYSEATLAWALENGFVEVLSEPLVAPKMALDEFLPYVVASLSGSRKAAIASNEGFCLAKIGYSDEEADTLAVAAADFFDFVNRQEQRGLNISGQALSLFNEVDLIMPKISFVFLWIDGTGFVLILDGEPLTNNRAFVELVWAIKTSGLKFQG